MIYTATYNEADARARDVHVNGRDYVLREYVGAAPKRGTYVEGNESNDNGQPQGFLVDQPSDAITLPHFHEHNQFQVFIDGSGMMGKQAAAPLALHYAGKHTPYGPIKAGPEGIRYFTLRQRWDPGAKYMPAMRDKLVRGQQRHALAANLPAIDDASLATEQAIQEHVAIEAHDDGLTAVMYTVPAGSSIPSIAPATGGGQYWLVTAGSLSHNNQDFDHLSCFFVTPDEPAIDIEGGEHGVQVLVMQFPLSPELDS